MLDDFCIRVVRGIIIVEIFSPAEKPLKGICLCYQRKEGCRRDNSDFKVKGRGHGGAVNSTGFSCLRQTPGGDLRLAACCETGFHMGDETTAFFLAVIVRSAL